MNYYTYFTSEYSNLNDDFKIVIRGKDSTFTEEQIRASATLSYKDVDNTLEPIRGAQLDVNIDANIDKPFNLFLDFRDDDFKVLFYRNNILIFSGFVNAEGVQQDYTSINWVAQLTAFDNLGSLKNKEFEYNNELPSEFVFMDKCLKQTGLDLPIAFFDDINQKKREFSITSDYGAVLNDGVRERIIKPEVFVNDNGTYKNCEDILKDILQKYNAVLMQQNIYYYDESNEEFDNQLCWLFCRVPLLKKPYSHSNRPYQIKRINNYANVQIYKDLFENENLVTPNIVTLGTFSSPRKLLATDEVQNLLNPDAIHKNKNQVIRQTRGLQNFRFEHVWVKLKDLLFYDYDRLIIFDTFYFQNNYIRNENELLVMESTTDTSSAVATIATDLSETIQLQDEARIIELNGTVTMINNSPFIPISRNNKYIRIALYQIIEGSVNEGVYIARPYDSDDNPVFNFEDIAYIEWEQYSTNVNDAFTGPTNDQEDYIYLFYTRENFNNELELNFDLQLPAFLNEGGKLNIHFQQFSNKGPFINEERKYTLTLNELNVRTIPPERLGEGEYHDANNQQSVSTKVDDPIEVINADETGNFFANGLKRINENDELVNYDYWTSIFNVKTNRQNLLELTSIERVRLFSKSQNIFSGDIHGYLPFFSRISNTAFLSAFPMMFTKWVYDTVDNTISAEMMENDIGQPDVNYEKTFIFEDEDKKLIK